MREPLLHDGRMQAVVLDAMADGSMAKKPIFGICLGNQMLGMAAGAEGSFRALLRSPKLRSEFRHGFLAKVHTRGIDRAPHKWPRAPR